MGALDEAALYLAQADDLVRARQEIGAVIEHLVGSLAIEHRNPEHRNPEHRKPERRTPERRSAGGS